MGLLCRIIKWLYLNITKLISHSLVDDPYGNPILVEFTKLGIILLWLFCFGGAIGLIIWAISLEILLKTLLSAYLAAYVWSKFCHRFTPFGQEMYLIVTTVGLTVLIGTQIQLHRMLGADVNTLKIYYLFLLIVGFILWGITVFNVNRAAKPKPVLATKTLEYKQRFRVTKLPSEIPANNPAQAYLKKLK